MVILLSYIGAIFTIWIWIWILKLLWLNGRLYRYKTNSCYVTRIKDPRVAIQHTRLIPCVFCYTVSAICAHFLNICSLFFILFAFINSDTCMGSNV
jgi:hypothetical protein